MKKQTYSTLTVFLFLLLFFYAPYSFAQEGTKTIASQKSKSEEAELMQIEQDLNTASLKGDKQTFSRLLADDFTEVSIWGDLSSKEEIVKQAVAEENVSIELSKIQARIYGTTAVLTGTAHVTLLPEKSSIAIFRFTDTFIKNKSNWQLLARQQTILPVWKDHKLQDNEFVPITAMDCKGENSLKSVNSNIPAYVRFTNASSGNVTLHWINFEGKRDPRKSQIHVLEPGKSINKTTFLTHPFVITDANGNCKGVYQPIGQPAHAVIK